MADNTDGTDSTGSILKSLAGSAVAGAATGGIGWLAAIPSLWKLGASLFQHNKADSLTTQRPVYAPPSYSIPPEVQEYLSRTQNRLLDPNLPGQSIMEQKLGANTSNATAGVMESGKDSGDILNTISRIYSNQNDATNNLGATAAKNYQDLVQKKDSDVANALLTSAAYKDRKYSEELGRYKEMFQGNQLDPYNQSAAAASALRNASGQNAYGGVNDLSTIAMLMGLLKKKGAVPVSSTGGTFGVDTPPSGTSTNNFV